MSSSRRGFIKKIALASFGISGVYLLSSCGNNDQTEDEKSKSSQDDPCSDQTLSEAQKSSRDQFEYVAETPYPEKRCDNCTLWIEPEEGEFCGGCQIIEGPINPAGYCNQWIRSS